MSKAGAMDLNDLLVFADLNRDDLFGDDDDNF
jgi:hypothetical protein